MPVGGGEQGRTQCPGRAPVFATGGSRYAVGSDVVVTVGLNALLLVRRGYVDPAARACPGPRFECARGVSGEIGADLLFANLETRGVIECRRR